MTAATVKIVLNVREALRKTPCSGWVNDPIWHEPTVKGVAMYAGWMRQDIDREPENPQIESMRTALSLLLKLLDTLGASEDSDGRT